MRRSLTFSLLTAVVLASSLQAQRAPQTGIRTLVTDLQLHELLISPASDAVFNASTDPPTDDKGWTAARNQALILADADSDGNHIATLLLTFIYRHLPLLIANGKVFLAQPPLYRIDIGKETFWALDDAHRDRLLKLHGNGRASAEITRFKGLGEMMPKVLWETTLNPRTRRLQRVEVADQIQTDRIINELMGKDASARFRFIMERAEDAQELDV